MIKPPTTTKKKMCDPEEAISCMGTVMKAADNVVSAVQKATRKRRAANREPKRIPSEDGIGSVLLSAASDCVKNSSPIKVTKKSAKKLKEAGINAESIDAASNNSGVSNADDGAEPPKKRRRSVEKSGAESSATTKITNANRIGELEVRLSKHDDYLVRIVEVLDELQSKVSLISEVRNSADCTPTPPNSPAPATTSSSVLPVAETTLTLA